MIGARAAQGLGAALMTPAALAITMTMTTYAGAQRAKALAMWGAVGGLGIAVVAFLHAGPARDRSSTYGPALIVPLAPPIRG